MEEARASAGVDPLRLRARLALFLATTSMHRLETDAADEAVSEAFEVLESATPELASAWALRSWVLMHRNQIPEAAAAARNALRLALANGSFEDRARAYSALTKPGLAGEIGPGIEVYANEAVRLAREHHHDGYLFEALVSREVLRQICLQPHTDEALASAREAVELAHRMDSVPSEGAARIILGAVYVSAGLWDDAERELTSGPAVACPVMVAAIMRRVTLARLLDARGRTDEAGDDPGRDRRRHVPARRRLALDDAGEPPPGDRRPRRRPPLPGRGEGGPGDAALPRLQGAAGRRRRGDPGGDRRGRRCAGAGGAGRRGRRRRLPGGAADGSARPGRAALRAEAWDTAVAEASVALPLADTVAQPFERARLLLVLGTALGRRASAGDRDRARALLGEALEVFERLGARPSTDEAVAELARLDAQPEGREERDEGRVAFPRP